MSGAPTGEDRDELCEALAGFVEYLMVGLGPDPTAPAHPLEPALAQRLNGLLARGRGVDPRVPESLGGDAPATRALEIVTEARRVLGCEDETMPAGPIVGL